MFATDAPTLLIVSYKDDATEFNGCKKGTIVGKGVINNRMSNLMMQRLEKVGIPYELAWREPFPSPELAVLTDLRSVGVMGDVRTYGCTVVLRAVMTDDYMTAEWIRIPYEVFEKTSSRITNEIKGITRVVYDITSKPPATVE